MIAADRLSRDDLSRAAGLLDEASISSRGFDWLDEGSAADIECCASADDGPRIRVALEGKLSGVDIVVQPAAHRVKRLLVADMDSTMIAVECIDELADYAGLKAEVAAITERAMRGELDFEQALEARLALLAGMDAGLVDLCREERVRITPGARTLVATMKARGSVCILVSGGFTRFADAVAQEIGFDRVVANVLEVAQGRLTGRLEGSLVGAEGKRRALLEAAAEHALPIEDSLAVGDGANDIPMLKAAGLGVAYRAKAAAAAAAGARIDHHDLSALLYAQGYPRAEWVTG